MNETVCITVIDLMKKAGYDISIETKTDTKFYSLTHGELEAINHLTKSLKSLSFNSFKNKSNKNNE